jgi:hypothetical protein
MDGGVHAACKHTLEKEKKNYFTVFSDWHHFDLALLQIWMGCH